MVISFPARRLPPHFAPPGREGWAAQNRKQIRVKNAGSTYKGFSCRIMSSRRTTHANHLRELLVERRPSALKLGYRTVLTIIADKNTSTSTIK